jgi:hypothetical protein
MFNRWFGLGLNFQSAVIGGLTGTQPVLHGVCDVEVVDLLFQGLNV